MTTQTIQPVAKPVEENKKPEQEKKFEVVSTPTPAAPAIAAPAKEKT